MLRLLGISLISFALFFPSYWVFHSLFGENTGAVVAIVLAIFVYPSLLSRVWKYYPPIDVVPIEPDDEFNKECIARSRNELYRLEEGLAEGKKEAFVKYAIRHDDNSADHVWGLAHSITDGDVVVSLVNEPVYKADETDLREKIPLSEIQDWMLMDKEGNCEGGYTHLAMVNAYKKLYGKVPKEYLKDLQFFTDIDETEYL